MITFVGKFWPSAKAIDLLVQLVTHSLLRLATRITQMDEWGSGRKCYFEAFRVSCN